MIKSLIVVFLISLCVGCTLAYLDSNEKVTLETHPYVEFKL